jgi:hypothetical protein
VCQHFPTPRPECVGVRFCVSTREIVFPIDPTNPTLPSPVPGEGVAGTPRPAAILGLPVGFVGAAESKAALEADRHAIAFLTVRGRIGGSAMAAAAVNALARASQ